MGTRTPPGGASSPAIDVQRANHEEGVGRGEEDVDVSESPPSRSPAWITSAACRMGLRIEPRCRWGDEAFSRNPGGWGSKGIRVTFPTIARAPRSPAPFPRTEPIRGGPRGVGGAGLLPELETKPRCLGQSSDARGLRPRSRVAAQGSSSVHRRPRGRPTIGIRRRGRGYTRTVRGGTDGLVWEVPYGSPTGGDRVDTREPSTTPSIRRLAAVDRTGVSDAADARVATVRDRCEGTPAVCSGFEYLHW